MNALISQGSSLVKNLTVEGNVAFGRFGHSLTSLGDLNDDGCDGKEVAYIKFLYLKMIIVKFHLQHYKLQS